jgi:hypothetical protein
VKVLDYLLRRYYWMLTRLFWVKVGYSTYNSTYMCMASLSLSRSTRQWSHFCPASTLRQSSCDYESSRFCKLWHIHYTTHIILAGPCGISDFAKRPLCARVCSNLFLPPSPLSLSHPSAQRTVSVPVHDGESADNIAAGGLLPL